MRYFFAPLLIIRPSKIFRIATLAFSGSILLGTSQIAIAQNAFDLHAADMTILQAKSIQNAIGITTAERNRMNVFAIGYGSRIQAYKKELIKEHKTKFDPSRVESLQAELKRQVFAELTPAQLKRLREISLQHDGIAALGDDVVAKKVGLSPSQLDKVRKLIVNDRTDLGALERQVANPIVTKYRKLKPKTPAAQKGVVAKFRAEMSSAELRIRPRVNAIVIRDHAKIMAVLSPAQRSAWNSLLGKPFKS
jgi:hypothetical protein